ncbi:diguanylate cyclase [Dasania sp. GY-MA-18]|uniref:diguanylate cyclase n=1 Tax=Dasania phycosphaerae TaxID=2950436 RepID=A0A9J6RNP1_9GAMM|nr:MULTISPECIES: diguanylate cyclase [Dasania]MCR8923327.1 diguanylate cyclase [Dasania sp. GY-MA-18]MCZ0865759.1 diguanylate cyclase [Dasania phycosphaerae]MCZ0869484.1 diguanylate cyclase [Dasania phycosphaerae]
MTDKLEDEFHLLNAETMDELLALVGERKRVEMLLVYTESLAADCAQLRANEQLRGLPILAVGRYGSEQMQDEAITAGAIDYIDVGNVSATVLEARVRSLYELKARGDQLAEIARLDALTAVPNRYYFEEAIDVEWRRCCREFNALTLIMIDVDGFTAFNEHYGAGVGDNCLKRIAKVVENNCLRAADVVARFDSDEFVVLLPGTEFENAMRVGENICRAVAALDLIHEYSDCSDIVTVSIGVASIDPSQDQDYKLLVNEAEEMLHSAQQHGGNQALGVAL